MMVIIANSAATLTSLLDQFVFTGTVEASFGNERVRGSVITLDHHGDWSGAPCPCELPRLGMGWLQAIGLSHLDLDAVGGIAALLSMKGEGAAHDAFWRLAAKMDTLGVHRLDRNELSELVVGASIRISDVSRQVRETVKSDGSAEITEVVRDLIREINEAINGEDGGHLRRIGTETLNQQDQLDHDSFVEQFETAGGLTVILRKSDRFVNHLYGHGGMVADAVLSYNTERQSATLSFERAIEGISAADLMVKLAGPGSGGHAAIAGSPRDRQLSWEDVSEMADQLRELI